MFEGVVHAQLLRFFCGDYRIRTNDPKSHDLIIANRQTDVDNQTRFTAMDDTTPSKRQATT